ncbi:hypothetical protein SEA_JEGGS_37 [Arthrobacter phage JEGGS]|uniref:Uncharacterized protein n=4 Tax=Mudcatvirus TaxID=1982088 RepID=A0A222Z6Z7_9CAUD|nr:hypothetical protein PQB76_gp037 [Arthrobacter phage Cheesy]YP_010666418.1 hypothetical protein PQB78_gp34 [Arthrobacter phage Xenomorph]YP_010666516.1 hypothetical protein PQB79_gp037 [Arthrobacter phage Heisenberger]YP_010666616.1 hypothetical protein PQB80_gp037 [Arthrobacter phage JEGGS]ASR80291.1 hypothetical protein SEA_HEISENBERGER_37 [Arthrobacter phage Heisenberger]ASR84617.1 hypothetical protein SEA_CHEESY_37 [Arthrobacter phage Cheesy]QDH47947.1 hypothetical protein SEA_XENOMORP
MFKNRHIQVKLVKDQPVSEEAVTPSVTPEDIQRVAKNVVKYVAVGAAAVLAAATILDTVSKIVVDKATSSDED